MSNVTRGCVSWFAPNGLKVRNLKVNKENLQYFVCQEIALRK